MNQVIDPHKLGEIKAKLDCVLAANEMTQYNLDQSIKKCKEMQKIFDELDAFKGDGDDES